MNGNGMLVVVSAPSGCGKDTVFKEIRKKRDDIVESVSATTRKPRDGEIDGVNYYFLSDDEFKKLYPDSVSIFLVPPSWETLEQRLRARNSEAEEMIQKRLKIAKSELLCQDKYDYKVVNDNLDDCVNDIEKILCEELKKRNNIKNA